MLNRLPVHRRVEVFVGKRYYVSPSTGSVLEIYATAVRSEAWRDIMSISPKLFTAALEDVFRLLDWNGVDINNNGEYITHLRFTDDIIVTAETTEYLSAMLNGLISFY